MKRNVFEVMVVVVAVIVIVTVLFHLCGCQKQDNQGNTIPGGFRGQVKEFQTSNGLQCIYASGIGYGGGLSCNWPAYNAD